MLRATTNLVVDEALQLDRKLMKDDFLFIYNKGYTGLEPVFINKLWMATFMPDIPEQPNFGKDRRGIREWSGWAEKNTLAGLLILKKVNDANDPHFIASVPLASFNRYEAGVAHQRYSLWFTKGAAGKEDETARDTLDRELRDTSNDPAAIVSRNVDGKKAIANAKLDARATAELSKTLLSLSLKFKGGMAVVYANFKISAPIAQQLTTTEWPLIRNIDLYPLLMQWVVGQFGYKIDASTASFPISKIAKTLPKVEKGEARVNDDGLAIDATGNPMWLPHELDNTSRYEDQFTQSGDNGDGSFSLINLQSIGDMEDPMKAITKLPKNIPVLIDWVNKKYAYTQTTGILKVQDLSRFKAADAAHIHTLLTRLHLSDKEVSSMAAIAGAVGVEPVVKFKPDELAQISNDDPITAEKLMSGWIPLMEYWDLATAYAVQFVTKDEKTPVMDDFAIDGHPIFRPFGRWIKQALAACLNNIDTINTRYSVAGVSTSLGKLTLLKYAGSETIRMEANKLKAAAANQKVDPDWEPPSIPMLGSEGRPIGMLPHQKKVRNLMKDSPDFAILPVQAGGGKSVLTITDVLYEIKANRSQPYLILCPPHLVAQYVKEIVFFTGGKLNVVPINSYMIMRNGMERLTAMMATAPRNTVVVCDYDVLRGKQRQVCYGTTNVTVYPVIEFLRQFKFGYCMLDESHSVKNQSQRTKAAMVLIADIPKKRLASGTMAHDSPSDLAIQIAILDPTLFGSRAEFNDRFGQEVKGEKVIEWKPGAQRDIMRIIKSRVVVAGAMRKEWAALLPTAEENFHGVELTPAQQSVYQAILTEALDKMREDAKSNPALRKFFESQGQQVKQAVEEGEEDDEAEDAADENAGGDLEALLGFYLARLEQFITAPTKDDLGDKVLKGDDRVSPKVTMIIKRIRLHLSGNLPGKVLVFTNYTASAEEIFEQFPPDIKKVALLYVAAEKTETGAAFENDERYKVMVGVENSMNTGLNLQFVSRLIRTETVWNPGTLEQGNSRVNRPELKKAERRDKIYYDWIVANNTLDITKISRLISKIIAVAKFENTDNPAYEEIPDVPIIAMNADSIQALNNWENNLKPYGEAYREYKQVQFEDYAAYRKKHGDLKLEPLAVAPTPKDAKLMYNVPYTPGLELFDAGKLGLVRVDEYLRMDSIAGATVDEEDEEAGEMTDKQKERQRMAQALLGKPIHTEFGDGVVKSISVRVKKVLVSLNDGSQVTVMMSASFVKTNTFKGETRELLLKSVGKMPVDVQELPPSPIVRADKAAARKALKKEQELPKTTKVIKKQKPSLDLNVELFLNVSNGFLGLTYFVDNDAEKSALQALGFRPTPPHVLAEMKNSLILKKLFAAWEAKGFTIDRKFREMGVSNAIHDMYLLMKGGGLAKGVTNFNFSTRNNLMNFFKEESKPSASKKEFKPYPMIEDGKAYIVMHTRGQAGAANAIKVTVPGVRWQQGADSMVFYGLDLAATGNKIKEIMASGIEIANIKDLQKQFTTARKSKIRKGEE